MKIDDSRAAIRRYELRRASEDHQLDPEVPEDPGPVHAVLFDADYAIPPPREAGTAFERFAKRAACGARVKVIFPMAFDTEEPDACPRCRFTCNFTGENRFDSTPRIVPRATGILRHCPTAAWSGPR